MYCCIWVIGYVRGGGGGEEDKAKDRVGDGFTRESCRGFPVVFHKQTITFLYHMLMKLITLFPFAQTVIILPQHRITVYCNL